MSVALSLDFINTTTLDARITASGGANGTRINSSGVIVAATTPRYDYDPVTLAPKGVLIEEQRTNIALRSEQLDNALWTAENSTIGVDAIASPDGNITADKIISAASTGRTGVTQGITVTSAPWTLSFFVKPATGVQFLQMFFGGGISTDYANFDIQNGIVTAGTNTSASITVFPNGWYRISITTTMTAGNSAFFLSAASAGNVARGPSFVGDGTKGFYAWGAQIELGAFATSYIHTTTATVTRTADSLTMTGTNFSSWFSSTAGTFICEADYLAINQTINNAVFGANDGSTTNRSAIFMSGANIASRIAAGGVGSNPSNSVSLIANTVFKVALTYGSPNNQLVVNGILGTSSTTSTGVANTQLGIGGDGGVSLNPINGHIRWLIYDNTRLADMTLQADTGINVGTITASATASGTGIAVFPAVGSSAGAATASATGRALFPSIASATGVATATATGVQLQTGVGSITAGASVNGVSLWQQQGIASSVGAGAASGVGIAIFPSIGTIAAGATVSGTGADVIPSVGTIAGVAFVLGAGQDVFPSVGSSAGIATVNAVGRALFPSVGSSAGVGLVSGVGRVLFPAVGTIAAGATVTGSSLWQQRGVGTAVGQATVNAVGEWVWPGVGTSIGQAIVFARGAWTYPSVGSAAGHASVMATGQDNHTVPDERRFVVPRQARSVKVLS